MTGTEVTSLINGAIRFVAKCRMQWHRSLEESSEGFALGQTITTIDFNKTTTNVIVLTDHRCPKPPGLDPKIDGKDVAWSVWDLERFHVRFLC